MKTAKRTMEIFRDIDAREHLKPFALAKISIALAIRKHYKYCGEKTDSLGLELDLDTITGKNRLLYRKLIEANEEKRLTDEEFFPTYIKAYLDYGAELLSQEYKYTNDIYSHLVELDKGI